MQMRKLPLLIIVAGLALAAAAVVWVIQTNQPENSSEVQPAAGDEGSIPFPEIERISVEQAFAAHKAGEAVLLDVRDFESYQSAHITGAVHIPLGELESRLGELDPKRPLIPY